MAQIANIAINDGQATPVLHTFVPANPQSGSTAALWLDKSPANPIGWNRITLSVSKNGNNVYKTRITLALPVLASVPAGCCVDSNVPAVSYTEIANIEISSPQFSTLQQRKDLRVLLSNLLQQTVVVNAIDNLETAF